MADTFTVKDGTCYLFENKFKKKETHPDLVGDMVLTRDYRAGDKIKLMAYIRKTKGGRDFVYIMESNYDPASHASKFGADRNAPREDRSSVGDDDIPF